MIANIRAFSPSVRYYLLTSFIIGLGVDGVLAVLFNLYLLRLGYNTEFIGIINAAALFSFAIGSLAAGILGGRLGSRRMLVVAVLVITTGLMALATAEQGPSAWQGVWLGASYVTIFAGQAMFFVNGSPFMMSWTTVTGGTDRSTLFSIQTAVQSSAGFLGSLVGGILPAQIAAVTGFTVDDPLPFLRPIQGLGILVGLAFFVVILTSEADATEQPAKTSVQKGETNWQKWLQIPFALLSLIAVIRLMQVAGLGAVSTFFNVYLDTELEASTATIGVLTSLSRMIGVPAALMVPWLTKRYSNLTVAIFGTFLSALFLVPVALIPNWIAAGLGFIATRAMTSVRFPSFQIYVLERFETRWHALAAGAMAMAAGLSFALMALWGGFIAARFSFRELFLLGASITAFSAILLLIVQYVSSRRQN